MAQKKLRLTPGGRHQLSCLVSKRVLMIIDSEAKREEKIRGRKVNRTDLINEYLKILADQITEKRRKSAAEKKSKKGTPGEDENPDR